MVTGGSLAAALDILAAFAISGARGAPPVRVLQAIASGLLGPAAFQGGSRTAALGMFLHLAIAFGAAAAYYVISRRWQLLVRRPILSGITYGVIVYVVMNQVVLPLSRVNLRPSPWAVVLAMVVVHMVCVGLPIAWTAARWHRRPRTAAAAGLMAR